MISEVAHTDTVESCITSAIKENISFDWITFTGCPLHHQRTDDEIVRSITRISIPCWCKQKNESLVEATRWKALKRKFHILLHQWVSMNVVTLHFYIMVTMLYGICVVLVIFRARHYFLFFVAALSVTTLLL